MTDTPQNSASLQQRHAKVYQDLYSRCFLVVSTPTKFCWSGEFGHHIGAPLIVQNLPLRAYVGFEPIKTRGRIEVSDLMYVPSQDRFITQMNPVHRRKLERYVAALTVQQTGNEDFPGFRIHSLCEVSPGNGLSASGAFAAALSTALLLHNGKIVRDDIQEWQKTRTYRLPQNHSFDKTFRQAWKFSSLLHDGISTGSAAFTSFVGSVYPIVYYSERRGGLTVTSNDPRVPLNIRDNYAILDRLFYGGLALDELFNWKDQPTWPVECFLIYSGKKGGGRLTKSFGEIDDILGEVAEMVTESFAFTSNESNAFTPIFYQLYQKEGLEGLRTNYLGLAGILSLQVLYGLREIFELGSSDRSTDSLFRAVNWYHDALKLLGRWTPSIEAFTNQLYSALGSQLGIDKIGIKLTGSGRGGDLLVVTSADNAQSVIEDELSRLRKLAGSNVWLDFASTRDGWEERGVILEQYLKENVYSSFVSQGSVALDVYSAQGKTSLTMTLDEFESKKATMPLLCDCTTHDILLKGRQLTSRELKTSKTTVVLLKYLLEHVGEGLTKSTLPVSSYTSDRNEIQSKILTPLQSTLRKALKRTLPITLQGPVRQYSITAGLPPFEVYILTKRI